MNNKKIELKEFIQMIKDFRRGIIIVCPYCTKVDIDPSTHFTDDTCDPAYQNYRQTAMDYYD